MSDVRLSSAAILDIRKIRAFSKQRFGAEAAQSYIVELETTLDMLGMRPLIGKSEVDLGYGARSFPYGSHRIYYRVSDLMIEILRILHQSQDVTAAFGKQQ